MIFYSVLYEAMWTCFFLRDSLDTDVNFTRIRRMFHIHSSACRVDTDACLTFHSRFSLSVLCLSIGGSWDMSVKRWRQCARSCQETQKHF
jgi:hypothetical protein